VADWFVKNVRDAYWTSHEKFGSSGHFEPGPGAFEQLGINIRVLEPGQPNCLYHRENLQEDFLVLSGECLLLVDGEERPLKAWDFVHLPPDVDHVMVGAGEGPSVILMVGARSPDEELFYPVVDVAQKHGAAAEEDTPDPDVAYAPYRDGRGEGRPASWDSLPWA
jgi:uncharacterized cupin superfamily protein